MSFPPIDLADLLGVHPNTVESRRHLAGHVHRRTRIASSRSRSPDPQIVDVSLVPQCQTWSSAAQQFRLGARQAGRDDCRRCDYSSPLFEAAP
jgi:hypothetical protein